MELSSSFFSDPSLFLDPLLGQSSSPQHRPIPPPPSSASTSTQPLRDRNNSNASSTQVFSPSLFPPPSAAGTSATPNSHHAMSDLRNHHASPVVASPGAWAWDGWKVDTQVPLPPSQQPQQQHQHEQHHQQQHQQQQHQSHLSPLPHPPPHPHPQRQLQSTSQLSPDRSSHRPLSHHEHQPIQPDHGPISDVGSSHNHSNGIDKGKHRESSGGGGGGGSGSGGVVVEEQGKVDSTSLGVKVEELLKRIDLPIERKVRTSPEFPQR